MTLSDATLQRIPKVLLHDHLDGGLRPQTIIELARDQSYRTLPTADAGELAEWFHRDASTLGSEGSTAPWIFNLGTLVIGL